MFLVVTQLVQFCQIFVFYYSYGGLLKLICRESGTPCHFAGTLKFGTLRVLDTISFLLSATTAYESTHWLQPLDA